MFFELLKSCFLDIKFDNCNKIRRLILTQLTAINIYHKRD
jgi:hypothetical protein